MTAMSAGDTDMTIGQFSMTTGLTPKALRLYDERGILTPAAVDPDSGYRWYSTRQVRHGQLLWALREAGVGLADLGDLDRFDIGQHEERRRARREYEDTAFRMARAITGISLDDWPVTTVDAPEQPWVASLIRLEMPDDGAPGAVFAGLFATIPHHRAALRAALDAHGDRADGPSWTTTCDTPAGATRVDLLVCCPSARDQRQEDWDGFAARVAGRLAVERADVRAGVLPARTEVVCRAEVDYGDEAAAMAADFAPRLAIDEHIRAHGLRPLSRSTRELTTTGPDGVDSGPFTVRDVERRG
jgi:DNA-binding transcriptional MerR regulator